MLNTLSVSVSHTDSPDLEYALDKCLYVLFTTLCHKVKNPVKTQ